MPSFLLPSPQFFPFYSLPSFTRLHDSFLHCSSNHLHGLVLNNEETYGLNCSSFVLRNEYTPSLGQSAWYMGMEKLWKGIVHHNVPALAGHRPGKGGVRFEDQIRPSQGGFRAVYHPRMGTPLEGVRPLRSVPVGLAVSTSLSEAASSRHQMFRRREVPKKGVDDTAPGIRLVSMVQEHGETPEGICSSLGPGFFAGFVLRVGCLPFKRTTIPPSSGMPRKAVLK